MAEYWLWPIGESAPTLKTDSRSNTERASPQDLLFTAPCVYTQAGAMATLDAEVCAASWLAFPKARVMDAHGGEAALRELVHATANSRGTLDPSRTYIPLLMLGCGNFYHLLIDMFARAVTSQSLCNDAILVVPTQLLKMTRDWGVARAFDELLAYYFPTSEIRVLEASATLLPNAVLPRVDWQGNFAAGLIGRATTATPCVRPGCMLHISRARSSARRISNEADLLALLARHGVETVYLEDMSYAEQVSLFARADLIIGAHGAGLAHLVNTRPGAWVVELLQTQGMYKQRIFQYLSELAGVNHLLIESATADTNGGGGNADMTADLEKLDALLLRYRQATVAFPV